MNNSAPVEVAGVSLMVKYEFLDVSHVNWRLDEDRYSHLPWELKNFLEAMMRQHFGNQIQQDLMLYDFHQQMANSGEDEEIPF